MTVVCALAANARGQSVVDPNLKVQTWAKGAFAGDGDGRRR
jgi:hypothetical protein